MKTDWFEISNIEEIDSPSLVIYKDRLAQNIDRMIELVDGNTERLMPHVKTNKCTEVVRMMIEKGIEKFKASTIAEAEMATIAGAKKILIAHQLVGPKIDRFVMLCKTYPDRDYSFLVDDMDHLAKIDNLFSQNGFVGNLYIDVNNGMNRSGIETNKLNTLLDFSQHCKNVKILGVHVYDGHHRQENYSERLNHIQEDFAKIRSGDLEVIAGGSPAFNVHNRNKTRICSPGTSVFWDWGYGEKFTEQGFQEAALIICRVISKPTNGIVTVDLGHKAVASENPIDKRIKFLNLHNYELISQSEEHGVLSVNNWNKITIGDVFYGIPYHVCPSVNLYEEMGIVENKKVDTYWKVIARKRKITI